MKWIAAHWVWDALADCWWIRPGYWWKFVAAKPGAAVAKIAANPVAQDVCRGAFVAGLGAAGAAFSPVSGQPHSPVVGSVPAPSAPWISGGFGGSGASGSPGFASGAFLPGISAEMQQAFFALPPCCSGLPPDYVISPPGGVPILPTQPVAEPATLAILLAALTLTLLIRRWRR